MKEQKYYCDFCKKEIKLPLTVKLKKHFMGKNYYGNFEPVYYEILDNEMCESCFKKIYRFIQELKKGVQ